MKNDWCVMSRRDLAIVLLLLLLLVSCQDDGDSSPTPVATGTENSEVSPGDTAETTVRSTNAPTPTIVLPTPTPTEPLAALVNGQPIFLSEYERELARYEKAQAELGLDTDNPDYQSVVLDALIERTLITQAAAALDLSLTSEMVDSKLAELQSKAGETGNFDAWLEANQWTLEEFHEALAAEMLTEQVVAAVTADVPFAVEQVRARYLQVDDLTLAQTLLAQIRNGEEFATLASQHSLDRLTAQNGGDLGFFARGSLLVPTVETAAFTLSPGEVSDIITEQGDAGNPSTYYLVQVIERDPQRPLTADLRYTLLQQTFESWLNAQWEQATIIRYVDTDA